MTKHAPLADDPDVQRDRAKRRQLASLLWAVRRQRRENDRATTATLSALVDLRVTLHQVTSWHLWPVLPEQ